LFAVWAAVNGAHVVAVEAQQGFAAEIHELAVSNHVSDRVHVEIAMASGVTVSGATQGIVADDQCWAATSHGTRERPPDASVPHFISAYGIDRIGLLKVDIEGGEFAVFGTGEDLHWLDQVDQIALEIHRNFGDPLPLLAKLERHGFRLDLRDNDGRRVPPASNLLDYAYGRRS
jgi:FkbM family methyltransferase